MIRSHPTGPRSAIPLPGIAVAAGLIACAAIAGAGPGDDGAEDPAATWIGHARVCLEKVRTLEADLTQEVIHRLNGRSEIKQGRLQLRRGGRLRLEYDAAPRLLLVSDGTTVRSWDESTRTVYEGPVRGTIITRSLSLALEGPRSGDFDIRWLGGAAQPAPGELGVIELRPTRESPLAARIVLTLTGTCPPLARVTIIDRAGTATRLTLANQRLNRVIPAGRFAFEPPPGAKIVKP
jgi:outer membrane lipoprotein-sorting protein